MGSVTRKRVIINADDFGLSPGVNRGIVTAICEGVATSTTMLTNAEFFDHAAALALENPQIAVGIHLTLLWGKPVSSPSEVSSLVDNRGLFPRTLGTFARRYFLGRLHQEEVVLEFRNQIKRFLSTGLKPTHLDTHKHVHCLPGIMKALLMAASEFGITKVRLPIEDSIKSDGFTAAAVFRKTAARRWLVSSLCRKNMTLLQERGFTTTDHFVGMNYTDFLDSSALYFAMKHLQEGATEIMCHPGYMDRELERYSRIPPQRDVELSALIDPKLRDYMEAQAIELVSYRELQGDSDSG